MPDFVFQIIHSFLKDLLVIIRQGWYFTDLEPLGIGRSKSRMKGIIFRLHERIIGNRNYPLGWISAHIPESFKLFKIDLGDAG